MTDALVLGFGIAGSAVAHALHRAGRTFAVVDVPLPNAGSPAAAGLLLPITGPRWVLRPHYDELLAACKRRYGPALVPIPVTRGVSERDRAPLAKRLQDPEYALFLSNATRDSVSWTGHYVHATALLATERRRHLRDGALREQHIDVAKLVHGRDFVEHEGERFRYVIVCTGHFGIGAPPFDWLDFRPARGEWCDLDPLENVPDGVYQQRHWVLQHQGSAACGSTYDWADLTSGPTPAAAEVLASAASALVDGPVRVRTQHAGVRAPTMDRWPYAGRHPDGLPFALLAGLGSTGLLTAPWCAELLVAHLFDGETLPRWLDLARRPRIKAS